MPSARLERHFADYASYHQTRGNQLCHMIGIPMIMVGLLGLLSQLRVAWAAGGELWAINGGFVLWLVASLWYLVVDVRWGAAIAVVSLAMWYVAMGLPSWAVWGLFIVGWVIQGIGHGRYEKKSPAFFTNFRHLLVGPLWILYKVVVGR